MTFEQLMEFARDWQSRLTQEQARKATEGLTAMGIVDVWLRGTSIDVDAVLAIAMGEPEPPSSEVREAARSARAGCCASSSSRDRSRDRRSRPPRFPSAR